MFIGANNLDEVVMKNEDVHVSLLLPTRISRILLFKSNPALPVSVQFRQLVLARAPILSLENFS